MQKINFVVTKCMYLIVCFLVTILVYMYVPAPQLFFMFYHKPLRRNCFSERLPKIIRNRTPIAATLPQDCKTSDLFLEAN